MADPKYANLPGIAYDQADCYETSDLPETDQHVDSYEEENESIERLHLNPTDAFSRFRGKSLSSAGVDFSDRLSRGRRTGYDARSGDWELVGEGEKETPVQKLQRLKCEIEELVEEVAAMKDTAKEDGAKETTPCSVIASQLEAASQQLTDLRLEETLGSELIRNLADPQGAQLKKLLSHLSLLKSSSPGTAKVKVEPGTAAAPGAGEPGKITYQLNYRPEQARLAQTARVAQLEQQLHRLEALVGPATDKLPNLDGGLVQLARQLSARAHLLDATQLDLVETRLGALSTKMDAVADKARATHEDSERDKKINELYELAKRTEGIAKVLPQTLERMVALESLHHQAVDFSKSLTQLESLQHQIVDGLRNNEELVKGVEKNFADNLAVIERNVSSLDARIANLKPKK